VSNSKYILEVTNASKNFGGLQAINRLSFKVEDGLIFSIIGPNGAGKTTAINLITGIYPPTNGEIFFEGHNLYRKRPYQLAYMGIGRTFQNIQVFFNISLTNAPGWAAMSRRSSFFHGTSYCDECSSANLLYDGG